MRLLVVFVAVFYLAVVCSASWQSHLWDIVMGQVLGELGGPCGDELQDISVFPGDAEYDENYLLFDQSFSDIVPAFVAMPESVEDVQRCLQCSAAEAIPCVVKSGGHSNAGYSTINGSIDNGFVISLKNLNGVSMSGDTVIVQAGALWEKVYDELDDKALITGPSYSTVGVGGFTLGGGRSVLSKRYGLAIDNVISMTMVTVNGQSVVVANATTNPDLFWALRGGGGGNFGIVTDFTFKTYATHDTYSAVTLEFGLYAEDALKTIGDQLTRDLSLHFSVFPGQNLKVTSLYLGSLGEAIALLVPLISLSDGVEVATFDSYPAYNILSNLNTPASGHYERGCLVEGIDEVFSEIVFYTDLVEGCHIVFHEMGGAISEILPNETAYYYRSSQFELKVSCDVVTADTVHIADKLLDSLKDSGYCRASYVDLMDIRLRNWQVEYYGGNYERLLEIKNKWNPIDSGYFHFLQEIGSDYRYKTLQDASF